MDIFKVTSWTLFNRTRTNLRLWKSDINVIGGARGAKIIFWSVLTIPSISSVISEDGINVVSSGEVCGSTCTGKKLQNSTVRSISKKKNNTDFENITPAKAPVSQRPRGTNRWELSHCDRWYNFRTLKPDFLVDLNFAILKNKYLIRRARVYPNYPKLTLNGMHGGLPPNTRGSALKNYSPRMGELSFLTGGWREGDSTPSFEQSDQYAWNSVTRCLRDSWRLLAARSQPCQIGIFRSSENANVKFSTFCGRRDAGTMGPGIEKSSRVEPIRVL